LHQVDDAKTVTWSAECVIYYCIDELVDASHLAIEKDSRAATYASFELRMQSYKDSKSYW
jgi:hypothetical protein